MEARTTSTRGSRVAAILAALALVGACQSGGASPSAAVSGAPSAVPSNQGSVAPSASASQLGGELVIATAGGAIQEALGKHFYQKFTDATGIKVTPVTINPSEQWAKVKADSESGNVEWDIVNVGPDMATREEFLLDLGPTCEAVPNVATNGLPTVCQRFGLLYIFGGFPLGYDPSKFTEAPASWADFWDVERFPGPRAMSSNETFYQIMIALHADGVPADEIWPLDLDRAFKKLDAIRPSVSVFWESGDQSQQLWRSGEVVMEPLFAGRAIGLREEGASIGITWEGAPRDISGFGVLKDAPNQEQAKAFLNFF